MQRKLLSIVIPVYNAEKYIEKLLNIFMKQNLEKVEIVLVIDGAKDKSFDICKEYEKKNNSFVVIHQENQGASMARNKGIENATGEYIAFVDSDDSIVEDYIEKICGLCEKYPADLIQLDAYIKKQEEITVRETKLKEGLADLNAYYQVALGQQVNEPWDKIYKAQIIREQHILFDKNMTIGEDISLTLEFLKSAESVYIHHEACYYYERNDEGICANAKLKHLTDMELLLQKMEVFAQQRRINETTKDVMNAAMIKGVFRTVAWLMQRGEKKKNITKEMQQLTSINCLLNTKVGEKSAEVRRILLKKKMFHMATMIVGMKNGH